MQTPTLAEIDGTDKVRLSRQEIEDNFAALLTAVGLRAGVHVVANAGDLTARTTATRGDFAVVGGASVYQLLGTDPTQSNSWKQIARQDALDALSQALTTETSRAQTAEADKASLTAATQTFQGQQVIKRPTSTTNTPLEAITDETNANRFTWAVQHNVATQQQIYAKTNEPAILGLVAPNGTDYADFTFDGANADIDVEGGDLNLRPLSSGKNVNVWAISANTKLRVGSLGFGQSLDLRHDGTNAHVDASSGYIGFQTDHCRIDASGNVTAASVVSATIDGGTF